MNRIITLALIMVLVLAVSASAFDGNRKGFVLGGGLGFGPVAKVSVDGFDGDYDKSGLATNVLIGYAWDEQNMIVYMRDAIFYSEEFNSAWDQKDIMLCQGFSGAAYYHYFGPVGKSAYLCGGLGFQDWTSLDSDFDSPDAGLGVLLGGGYEFARHVQIHSSLSFGKTSEGNADLNHTQFLITISAVAF